MQGTQSVKNRHVHYTSAVNAERVIAATIEQELTQRGLPLQLGPGQSIRGAAGFAQSHARDLLGSSRTLSTLARGRLEKLGFDVDDLLKTAHHSLASQAA